MPQWFRVRLAVDAGVGADNELEMFLDPQSRQQASGGSTGLVGAHGQPVTAPAQPLKKGLHTLKAARGTVPSPLQGFDVAVQKGATPTRGESKRVDSSLDTSLEALVQRNPHHLRGHSSQTMSGQGLVQALRQIGQGIDEGPVKVEYDVRSRRQGRSQFPRPAHCGRRAHTSLTSEGLAHGARAARRQPHHAWPISRRCCSSQKGRGVSARLNR